MATAAPEASRTFVLAVKLSPPAVGPVGQDDGSSSGSAGSSSGPPPPVDSGAAFAALPSSEEVGSPSGVASGSPDVPGSPEAAGSESFSAGDSGETAANRPPATAPVAAPDSTEPAKPDQVHWLPSRQPP